MANTIDITPTWRGVLPVLMAALEIGTDKGRDNARAELRRMADAADAYNAGCHAPKLMTGERGILAHFITSSDAHRAVILAEAQADPAVSGPLIQAMRYLITC